MTDDVTILQGDVLEQLRGLMDGAVHCVVTSPPYWGLRDYGVDGQIGLEPTVEGYVARLVEVFREVRRVLRDDGTLWLNLGDSYAGSGGAGEWSKRKAGKQAYAGPRNNNVNRVVGCGLKPKDLVGVPWRVAFALQADGWWLRSDIIWHKPNCMPESVEDRPTKAHEYVFLLSKSAVYFFDQEAIREGLADSTLHDRRNGTGRHTQGQNGSKYFEAGTPDPGQADKPSWYRQKTFVNPVAGRNARSVWSIITSGYAGAHFAVMPPEIPQRAILAGTSARGCCPACGAPFRRVVDHVDEVDTSANGSRFDLGKTAVNGGGRVQAGERHVRVAVGWEPGCRCAPAEPIPCTVLDPFLGSGTTLAVAVGLGRRGIGIELNAGYVELARARVAGVQRPLVGVD